MSNVPTDVRSLATRLREFTPTRVTLLWGGLLVLVELLVVLLYLAFAPVTPTDHLFYVYPFVWINVGLWAVLRTAPPPVDTPQRRAAMLVAVGYLLVLAWAGGLVARGYALGPGGTPGFHASLVTIPPGYGPILLYNSPVVKFVFFPYKVVGYLALGYLLYVTVLDAAGAGTALGGLLGLTSCVSCTWPVLASLATGVAGGASSVTAAVYAQTYGLSTLVFVITVAILAYRPVLR